MTTMPPMPPIQKELKKNFEKLLQLFENEEFLFFKFGKAGKWFSWSKEVFELSKKYDKKLIPYKIFFTDIIIMGLSTDEKYLKNKKKEFKRKLKKMRI